MANYVPVHVVNFAVINDVVMDDINVVVSKVILTLYYSTPAKELKVEELTITIWVKDLFNGHMTRVPVWNATEPEEVKTIPYLFLDGEEDKDIYILRTLQVGEIIIEILLNWD